MRCKTARSPCQPIHEQEDITRSSNPVAEARTFLEQTPEEKKSNGSAGFRFHLLHVRLAAFTKAGMYSVSFPPHVRCALPRCQLTLVKTRVDRKTWPTSRQFLGPRDTSARAPRCNDEGPSDLPLHTGSFPRMFAR